MEKDNFFGLMKSFDKTFDIINVYRSNARLYHDGCRLYPSEVHIIMNISDGINTVTELSKYNMVSKSAISQIISRLSKKNLVEKIPAAIGREVKLILTDTGREIVKTHTTMSEQMYNEVIKFLNNQINDADIDIITTFLSSVNEAYTHMIQNENKAL